MIRNPHELKLVDEAKRKKKLKKLEFEEINDKKNHKLARWRLTKPLEEEE